MTVLGTDIEDDEDVEGDESFVSSTASPSTKLQQVGGMDACSSYPPQKYIMSLLLYDIHIPTI